MNYNVFGGAMPAVEVSLDTGESIFTQSGGMSWMTDGISMETNMKGGLMKGIGRMFSGESLFMATYSATAPGQKITLASSMPGEIIALELDGSKEYIIQKQAFLAATQGIKLETYVQKKVSGGLFGGEGFVMQKVSGQGVVWLEIDGSVKEIELAPGERMKIDTSHIALYESSCKYEVETVKGFKNILFGGEGLFLTVLTGPGKAYLQTLTGANLAARIIPYIPTKSS